MERTDPAYYERIAQEERPCAERVAEYIAKLLREADQDSLWQGVLDVGCGPGTYVEALLEQGIPAIGLEKDFAAVAKFFTDRNAWSPGSRLRRHLFEVDATWENTEWRRPIVVSFEVGEHIPDGSFGADAYVKFLVDCRPEFIFFSAARPGQGGEGHINLQPKSYWQKKFLQHGYYMNSDVTEEFIHFLKQGPHMGWLVQNGMVLTPAGE